MDIFFIAIGVLVVLALLVWLFSVISDPAEVDAEELAEVKEESSAEHHRALWEGKRHLSAEEQIKEKEEEELNSHE